MVELRKRPPPKEPAAPPPAAKKGRASASKAQPASTDNSVTAKAKKAATKVKEAVTGSSETDSTKMDTNDTAAKQPTVEDASEPVAVKEGETGMIPETATTAPSSVTAPAPAAAAEPAKAETAAAPSNIDIIKQNTKGRGKFKGAANPGPVNTPINPKLVGSNIDPSQIHLTGMAAGESASAAPAEDATHAPAAAPAPAAAKEGLENPPETGKVEPAAPKAPAPAVATNTSAATASSEIETASVPLSTASVGKQIPNLASFGGEVETHTGQKTSLAALLASATSSSPGSEGGVVIFTYPKASTPGCTQQACSFRDNFSAFTGGTGLKIYGLSTDSTKANTTFATKQNLQYELLCDPAAAMTGALGMKKAPKSTLRGVVVIDGQGIVKVWFQGGPAKTVDAVKEYVASLKH